MPDRPTPSDVQGPDVTGSDAQEVGSGEGPEAVRAPSDSDAHVVPADHDSTVGEPEKPAPAPPPSPTKRDPEPGSAPSAAGPTEVIPRSAAADESVGAVAAAQAAETDVIAQAALAVPSPAPRPVPDAPTVVTSGSAEPPTELIPVVAPPKPPRRRRALLLTGLAVVGLLVVLYAIDLISSSGSVPRGVTVAGQEIGAICCMLSASGPDMA
jgi:hypothetical protein